MNLGEKDPPLLNPSGLFSISIRIFPRNRYLIQFFSGTIEILPPKHGKFSGFMLHGEIGDWGEKNVAFKFERIFPKQKKISSYAYLKEIEEFMKTHATLRTLA